MLASLIIIVGLTSEENDNISEPDFNQNNSDSDPNTNASDSESNDSKSNKSKMTLEAFYNIRTRQYFRRPFYIISS